jgi:alpha-D-ribose 1-methylphosphonate 5-triphosphate synthase subunit PhnH
MRPEWSGQELVRYTQRTFRGLLDSMARPGKVNRLAAYPLGEAGAPAVDPYLLGVACTLLDSEVGFCAADDREGRLSGYLAFWTGARRVALGEADFLFLTPEDDPRLLYEAKRGTLDYPDRGATAIVSGVGLVEPETAGGAAARGSSGPPLRLTGPGVPGEATLVAGGIGEQQVAVWREINQEYPLGIDVILVGEGRVACLPRSVKSEVRGSA